MTIEEELFRKTKIDFDKISKYGFKNLLKDIRNDCFTREAFIYEQSNRITKAINEKYGDEPEFEWKN